MKVSRSNWCDGDHVQCPPQLSLLYTTVQWGGVQSLATSRSPQHTGEVSWLFHIPGQISRNSVLRQDCEIPATAVLRHRPAGWRGCPVRGGRGQPPVITVIWLAGSPSIEAVWVTGTLHYCTAAAPTRGSRLRAGGGSQVLGCCLLRRCALV